MNKTITITSSENFCLNSILFYIALQFTLKVTSQTGCICMTSRSLKASLPSSGLCRTEIWYRLYIAFQTRYSFQLLLMSYKELHKLLQKLIKIWVNQKRT